MEGYSIEVKRPLEFMRAVIDALQGDDAIIALIGDLSKFDPRGIDGVQGKAALAEKSPLLARRLAGYPNIVFFPLTEQNKLSFLTGILPRIGMRTRIWHTLIEQAGQLRLEVYDNFNDPLWVGSFIGEDVLKKLLAERIIREYAPFTLDTDFAG